MIGVNMMAPSQGWESLAVFLLCLLVKMHMESYSAQSLVLQVRVSGWSLFLIMPADPSFDHMAYCVPSFPSVWDRLTVLLYLGNFHWQGFMLSLFIP